MASSGEDRPGRPRPEGGRIAWEAAPDPLRGRIEAVLGGTVTQGRDLSGGSSPDWSPCCGRGRARRRS